MRVNYYEVLGIERSATEAEIRDRFRQLAREHHPDRFTGAVKVEAEKRFQELTEAVNVLTNATRRRQHDSELAGSGTKSGTDVVQIAKAYVNYGVKAFKGGNYQNAFENFDLATKHNPQDAKSWHYLALAASRVPSLTRQAVHAIENAVQRDPVNPVYLKDAGLLCRSAGLVAKAERYFEEALQWDPDNATVSSALAELRHGRPEGGKGFTLFKKG